MGRRDEQKGGARRGLHRRSRARTTANRLRRGCPPGRFGTGPRPARRSKSGTCRRLLTLFLYSGMTPEELGLKMGNPASTAHRAAWQLFNKLDDPRLPMVEKLAGALGCQPKDLV